MIFACAFDSFQVGSGNACACGLGGAAIADNGNNDINPRPTSAQL